MTEASINALNNLRDLSTMKWYVIPLLAIVIYIYVIEIKRARKNENWEAIFAGLTLFGVDFVNETINGWILVLTDRSALWTAPGDTALRTMVGWNIEIMFMFAIAGIIFYNTLSRKRKDKIMGIPETWFWAVGYSIFCVFVEVLLNIGGLLVWEYPFWYRSFFGVWLIFLVGYFHFYAAIIFMLWLKSTKLRILFITGIYGVAVLLNFIGLGVFGWRY